ncbi:MAG: hypothetical protein GTO45_11955 [Candidatus Aminicenantes bacterium]|nr:hypothetical protein [Candidatus Aminicenantes bacterium]NIM84028.1 hypothetical protein [Candidatus Aminicenantes bacterium]NIN18806.1 hypothetical protein [Candidatus Aminicenantes bacterium]NIN42728.1 hypothetical protein [Candidatus Aminicenantes bacterium]NIN85462.1 hypothetical protein [Candidatus Aminicenantes bacterium]
MQEAVEIIEGLNNVQMVSLLKELNRTIYKSVTYQNVVDNLPGEDVGILALRDLGLETKKTKLIPEDSITAAKEILLGFAQVEDLAPILIAAWENIKNDDKMFIETIVAVGLLVNVTLFMASTEIKYEDGKFSFIKKTTPPKILSAIMQPINTLVKKL